MADKEVYHYVTMSRRSMLPVACHVDLKTATAFVAAQMEKFVTEGTQAPSDGALFVIKVPWL